MREVLREATPCVDVDTRWDTAERAVAPREMDDDWEWFGACVGGWVGDGLAGERREGPRDGRAAATVAMIYPRTMESR